AAAAVRALRRGVRQPGSARGGGIPTGAASHGGGAGRRVQGVTAGGTSVSRLSVSLLGAFRVDCGAQRLTEFRYDKVRALFAYLVSEGGVHRREALAELFWPEQPEGVARGNLRQALATLRKV